MFGFWNRIFSLEFRWFRPLISPLVISSQVISSASVDALWRKVMDIADVSWHPLIASTNVPSGLIPKPGLIYKAVTRMFPIPIRIFVEGVLPQEMLSVRILAIPGVEERVTYRIESTVWGTRVSYSVTLRGWLSPVVWSFIRPYAARVAAELAQAVENEIKNATLPRSKFIKSHFQDLLGLVFLTFSLGYLYTT